MSDLIRIILRAWTTRSVRNELGFAGLDATANLSGMMNEPPAYIAAAILAVNTIGE